MPNAALSEVELVARAKQGDLGSFSALVELYQERAIRTAYSILGNMEDARDLAQEAFIKAFERLADFRSDSRFYTWFYRILVNGCKDSLRKKKVRGFVLLCLGRREDAEAEEDPALRVPDPAPRASQAALNKELGQTIERALLTLPLRQRTAFTLRYYDGMSLEEIAESMGLSEGAVKAHLWQAGQKIRKLLDGYRRQGG